MKNRTASQKLLYELYRYPEELFSADELAERLGISREEVQREAEDPEARRLIIRDSSGRIQAMEETVPDGKLIEMLMPDIAAPVIVYEETASTNSVAKEQIQNGCPHGTLVLADRQSAGRGRKGHTFYSPKHTGLYFSLVLRLKKDDPAFRLTPAAAVAAVEAVQECTGITPGIKWVNDLYVKERKVAGILTEAVTDHRTGQITAAVVGIGINCRPTEFPEEIRDTAGSLNLPHMSRALLAAVLREKLLYWAERLKDPALMEEYRRHSVILGREITYTRNNRLYTGTARSVNEEGHLCIEKPDGSEDILQSGEISVRSWSLSR